MKSKAERYANWLVAVALGVSLASTPCAFGDQVPSVPQAAPSTQPEPKPDPVPAPEPAPKPNPTPKPDPLPDPGPSPTPAPTPTPAPLPDPAPAPGPIPAPEPPKLKADFWRSRPEQLAANVVSQEVGARQSDPLKFVSQDMTSIHGDLSAEKTDKPVQVKEQRVVKQLDTLIAVLEKQCKGGGGGSSANPSKPLASSMIIGGPGGQGEMINPDQATKQLGNLPPRQREAIIQSQTEGFPAGYEAILQSYYKRLAQEQTAEAGATAEATPASQQ